MSGENSENKGKMEGVGKAKDIRVMIDVTRNT